MKGIGQILELIGNNETEILNGWLEEQLAHKNVRRDLISVDELRDDSQRFLNSFRRGLEGGGDSDLQGSAWDSAKAMLEALSRSRALQGFTPSETASFVFSLKNQLFARMSKRDVDGSSIVEALLETSGLLDKLGLYTTEVFQKSREGIIRQQQNEVLELSTPVVTLAEGILALPLIGTLDSNRTQSVMETLLQKLVDTSADIAIIDITGVPTVDTLVAQYLMKTVAAARLMGAECILSGIRPQIAQTIVHLGIDLGHVHTKASLSDAFAMALRQKGLYIASSKTGAK